MLLSKGKLIAIVVAVALVALYVADTVVENKTADQQVIDKAASAFLDDVHTAITVIDPQDAAAIHANLVDSTEGMIEVARKDPDATYDGRTLRQVLSDAASMLSRDEPRVSERIESAIQTL